MCWSRDAGMAMVNMSIDLAEEKDDPSYYMDSMKLHKLLYLSQCAMLQQYGSHMFKEAITAHRCGPYVDGIGSIPAKMGFGLMKKRFNPEEDEVVYPSVARMDILKQILEGFGKKTTKELIRYTKETPPYQKVASQITADNKPEITTESMKKGRFLSQAG